jgi:hypothetical protein
MRYSCGMRLRIAGWIFILAAAGAVNAQMGVASGTDAGSGISWVFISLNGKVVGDETAGVPRLTAQCTKEGKGKLRFELLADVGDVPEVRFVPPFKATDTELFPPTVPKTTVTMEFLGYMKVKPVKRQWTGIDQLPGEWKYATPGGNSSNMEEIMFYLQYLRALPTLRLTLPTVGGLRRPAVVEFETAAWQAKVKAEPLCWASGL